MPTPSSDADNPEHIAGFTLLECISKGGMGSVHRARQISMDRIVAVKLLAKKYTDDTVFIERFLKEARAAARLSHPNIVQAIDVGDSGCTYYFAMELVEGSTLSDILREKRRIPPLEACGIISQIARALEHASRYGMLHLDIKPGNIMLTPTGLAKLADFGLARHVEDEDTLYTEKKVIFGTPAYMSAEQLRGVPDLDGRSDIYSLGVTFYELVTGRNPFRSPTTKETLRKVRRGNVPPAHTVDAGVPLDVSLTIGKMTAYERDDRYADASQLLVDLDALSRLQPPPIVHNLTQPGLASAGEGAPWRTGVIAALAAIAAALVVIVVALLLIIHSRSPESVPPERPAPVAHKPPGAAIEPGTADPADASAEADLKTIAAKATELMADDRYSEAFKLYADFATGHQKSAWAKAARNEANGVRLRAQWRVGDLAAEVRKALEAKDLNTAKKVYARIETIGLPEAVSLAKPARDALLRAERAHRRRLEEEKRQAARAAFAVSCRSARKLLEAAQIDKAAEAYESFLQNEDYAAAAGLARGELAQIRLMQAMRDAALKGAARSPGYRLQGQYRGAVVRGAHNARVLIAEGNQRRTVSIEQLAGSDLASLAQKGASDHFAVCQGLVLFFDSQKDYQHAYRQIVLLRRQAKTALPPWLPELECRVILETIAQKTAQGLYRNAHELFLYLKKEHRRSPCYRENRQRLSQLLDAIAGGYVSDMKPIPAGSFRYGKAKPGSRSRYLALFYMDVHEVTNSQYARFLAHVKSSGSKAFDHPRQPEATRRHVPLNWDTLSKQRPNCPVVGVDWFDAYAYARWRGKRLPTEIEWEKAARGGDGRKYPWGSFWRDNLCNARPKKFAAAAHPPTDVMPVGSFPRGKSPYDVLDMAGNAREWVDDQKHESKSAILRGGSFKDHASVCATDYPTIRLRDTRDNTTGFRCALDAPDLKP